MILTPNPSRRVFGYPAPVDLRKGYDGLFGLVEQGLHRDPMGAPTEGVVSVVETPRCKTVLVEVPDVAAAVRLAPGLVADGAQLIELCGGFGPIGTARVLEAIGGAVPIGAVGYGPESVDGVHAIFKPA